VFAGEALMSVWTGLENGIASADISPEELAPTSQQQLHWPKFGQHYETSGKAARRRTSRSRRAAEAQPGLARRATRESARRSGTACWHPQRAALRRSAW
jgi:hypothetical protein